MTPNLDDIRRDDELLDALGGRTAPRRTDPAGAALQAWVRAIDAPDRPLTAGRYARSRHTRTRVGVLAAATVATLSISGVAAAVGAVPGIAAHLGFVHRSADFGSGAAGPVSTREAAPPVPATTTGSPETSTRMPATGIDSASSASPSDPAALPRVLPGAYLRHPRHRSGSASASPTSPSTATSPVTRSSTSPSSATSTTSPSSGSSSSSTGSTSSSPSSSSSSTVKSPPQPTSSSPSTPPAFSPVSSPSSTGQPGGGTGTPHGPSSRRNR